MIEAILAAHDDPDQPGATFRAIDAALAHDPGHILFTVLVHHPALRQSERAYTNRPDVYPIGGRKPVTELALDAAGDPRRRAVYRPHAS